MDDQDVSALAAAISQAIQTISDPDECGAFVATIIDDLVVDDFRLDEAAPAILAALARDFYPQLDRLLSEPSVFDRQAIKVHFPEKAQPISDLPAHIERAVLAGLKAAQEGRVVKRYRPTS